MWNLFPPILTDTTIDSKDKNNKPNPNPIFFLFSYEIVDLFGYFRRVFRRIEFDDVLSIIYK